MIKRIAVAMLAVVGLAVALPMRPASAAVPAPTTLTYCTPAHTPLKMDFYRPAGSEVVPVVVNVHGGGWVKDDRTTDVTPKVVAGFLDKHLAFATIDYRLGDARRAVEDVACAIRYLRASAKKLKINAKHIGALGRSAGAQLVSLVATANRKDGFDVGQYLNQSSRVQAVVDRWGPVVFDAPLLTSLPEIPTVFGTADLTALTKYSPLTYVTPDDPPFLIVHGALDKVVPVSQSRVFAAVLRHQHVPTTLIVVAHAGHSLVPDGAAPSPTIAQVQAKTVAFFVAKLT